jgi:transposase
MSDDPKARERASLILQVQAGLLTATEAARKLGVSRKTYYQWERRGLEGMMEQLSDSPRGRPAQPSDPEKDRLQERLRQAEKELEEGRQVQELREILDSLQRTPAKKNSRNG